MNMLPSVFQKTNRRGAPVIGILIYGMVILIIEATGLANASSLSFMILVASVFWMVSYIISHINLLVLRDSGDLCGTVVEIQAANAVVPAAELGKGHGDGASRLLPAAAGGCPQGARATGKGAASDFALAVRKNRSKNKNPLTVPILGSARGFVILLDSRGRF